jgi:hypothetical protein
MEFDIFGIAGGKRTIEAESCETGEKSIIFKNKDGEIIWWANTGAIAFINYKKEEAPALKLVTP